eukprot:3811552-Pleurochrysis_carterae.AAC.1
MQRIHRERTVQMGRCGRRSRSESSRSLSLHWTLSWSSSSQLQLESEASFPQDTSRLSQPQLRLEVHSAIVYRDF